MNRRDALRLFAALPFASLLEPIEDESVTVNVLLDGKVIARTVKKSAGNAPDLHDLGMRLVRPWGRSKHGLFK